MLTRTLRVVLGDQLTPNVSLLADGDSARDVVLMVEVADETQYVPHHKKKIIFVLSAMRAFARELREAGWRVDYVKLDDPGNTGSLTGELQRAIAQHCPERIVTMEAGESSNGASTDSAPGPGGSSPRPCPRRRPAACCGRPCRR